MLEIEDAVAIEEGLGVGLGEGLGICLGSAVDCSGLDLIAVCVGVGLDAVEEQRLRFEQNGKTT